MFFLYQKYFQRIISINGTQHLITTTPSRGGVAVSGVAPVPRITSQFIPGAVTKQVSIKILFELFENENESPTVLTNNTYLFIYSTQLVSPRHTF